jgi:hypothetical protein
VRFRSLADRGSPPSNPVGKSAEEEHTSRHEQEQDELHKLAGIETVAARRMEPERCG